MSGDDQFTVVSEVYRSERRSKVLTRLPTDFFKRSEEYLANQRKDYSQAVLIPENPKTMMLQDQVKKLEKRLKHIYEIRERKITLAALDHLGGSRPPDNMTRKDRELFEHLVNTLKAFRINEKAPPVPESGQAKIAAPKAVPEVKQKKEPAAPEPEPQKVEKEIDSGMIVHVLEDIPSFVGPDHTYELKKDDMVTLPEQFANILLSKGKVRVVEG